MHYQEQMESLILGEERRRGNCVRDADAEAYEGVNSPSSFPNSPDDSDRCSSSSSRRGLSKHYKGKSQSFTSLSEALTVEDLAKPENPFNAKLKQRRESPHCRRFSGCGGASERNLSAHDVYLDGNGRPPRLSGNRPPLRAQTLSAPHISALLTRT
ncbi:Protein OXIDATIVE STRESS 3 LIKE 3 [Cardamine amara subsp. amara]|uniref:Protein OXIDATIVE STRESS 3 LIKE 3 n=1 Tax=Cardamine amara subsp. amara TaxID=228776 RepID=A0ABD1BGM5_CARAN